VPTEFLDAAGRIDLAAFQWLRSLQTPFVTRLLVALSDTARGGALWVGLTFLIAFVRPGRWPAAVQVLLAIILTGLLVESVAKPYFNRSRPFDTHPEISTLGYRSTTSSLPSGHAAHAAAAAYALSRLAPEGRVIFGLIAVLVAYSRIYIGVHYPADVIVGALFGWGVARFVVGGTIWRWSRVPAR
jgi:membrane-associated phospholipid phosphatase